MQQTRLNGAIDADDTAVTVDDALGFPSVAHSIVIDSEELRVTAGFGTTSWTVTRGYNGSTAAIHSDNAVVYDLPDGVINVTDVKAWNADPQPTADDGWMPTAVAAVNRAGVRACGIDLGPSTDTSRQYDASAVVRNGTRLYIPGGIREFLTVATGDGTTWTTITDSVRVGPLAHSRPAGEPGSYIEVIPGESVRLDASYFVRITATTLEGFGWDAWPADLVQDALAAYQRLALDKARGGQYPTEIAAMRYLHLPLWHGYRDRYFPRVR